MDVKTHWKLIKEAQTIVVDESDHDEYDLKITTRNIQRIWKYGKMRWACWCWMGINFQQNVKKKKGPKLANTLLKQWKFDVQGASSSKT